MRDNLQPCQQTDKQLMTFYRISGFINGPDASIYGKDILWRTLSEQILDLENDYGDPSVLIGFSLNVEGRFSRKAVKAGPGKRSYYKPHNFFSVDIGITLAELNLSNSEFKSLLVKRLAEGLDHLIPFMKSKDIELNWDKMTNDFDAFLKNYELSAYTKELNHIDKVVLNFLEENKEKKGFKGSLPRNENSDQ